MELSALPVQDGFRLRGEAPTRLETFVDAAFAFAVTLLVVSFQSMPDSVSELEAALRRAPGFLASFATLAMFWFAHYRFSRRFGLEDGVVVLLSLVLVAVTLLYVYPLRMIMGMAAHFMTAGWAPLTMRVEDAGALRTVYIIYALGFGSMCLLIALLNLHALRRASMLGLDPVERFRTRAEVQAMAILGGTAALSLACAALLPMTGDDAWMRGVPGMVYMLLPVAMPVFGVLSGRALRRMEAGPR